MKIALINDQPFYSGMGKYAFKIFELLKEEFALDFLLLDYKDRVLRNQKGDIIAQDKKFPLFDNKPFFWYRIHKKFPEYDLYHFANQNLSFLISKTNSIITCHDLAPLIVPDHPSEKIWRRFIYWGLKKALIIMADSDSTKKDLIKIYGISEKKIKTVYLGVEHNIFRPLQNKEILKHKLNIPEDFKVILNVGTEKYRKNIPCLLKAFAKLLADYKNIILIRVGRQSDTTRQLIRKLGIENNIKYFENVKENELPDFYNAADIFVMPSFYEGFGLPALEAMSCGTPVVVANTSSLPEIVGEAGLKVNPYSVLEIYEGIKKLLDNRSLYSELKEKGITQAKKFTWQKTADSVAEIYENFTD
ncbi:MAG: glycosyltransferase family 1 protein [candidate division WOR-3 bacterium]